MRRAIRAIAIPLALGWPAASAAAFELGGPCSADPDARDPGIHAAMRDAARRGDAEAQLALQRRYVREMCSNPYRWYGLAASLLRAGRADEAVGALSSAFFDHGVELDVGSLRDHPELVALLDSPRAADTALGRELDRLRRIAEARRRAGLERLAALGPQERPPEAYVARDACPFECCTFREWEVLRATRLFDAPGGTTEVARVAAGERVSALTGEVHLTPLPLAVLVDHAPFAAGEILFLLDDVGEGFRRVWREGAILEAEVDAERTCLRPGKHCWAEPLVPEGAREAPAWWIRMRTADGVVGWTSQHRHFGNKDACG